MALLEFYGQDCPHCIEMDPLVEKLEKELGVKVEKFEVWNSDENAKNKEEYDNGECGGVPYFVNTEKNENICGSTDYESLKKWAS